MKGTIFFYKKEKKANKNNQNVVFSEFLIMYSFCDFKFVPFYIFRTNISFLRGGIN